MKYNAYVRVIITITIYIDIYYNLQQQKLLQLQIASLQFTSTLLQFYYNIALRAVL